MELRILMRKETNYITSPYFPYEEEEIITSKPVLQYRKEEGPRGETWWGDWTDVPIEEE